MRKLPLLGILRHTGFIRHSKPAIQRGRAGVSWIARLACQWMENSFRRYIIAVTHSKIERLHHSHGLGIVKVI